MSQKFYFAFDLLIWFELFLAAISPLPDTSVPDPRSHRRRLSFKNSNHVTSLTSPLPHGSLDEPSEGVPLSPDNSTVGEVFEGPVKPQRSAPPPPPSGKLVHDGDIIISILTPLINTYILVSCQ